MVIMLDAAEFVEYMKLLKSSKVLDQTRSIELIKQLLIFNKVIYSQIPDTEPYKRLITWIRLRYPNWEFDSIEEIDAINRYNFIKGANK